MKFKYIGRCARSEVVFTTPDGPLVMPFNEPVEVPDSLAKKLSANDHFVAVVESDGETVEVAPKRRGRPPKQKTEVADDTDGTEASDAS